MARSWIEALLHAAFDYVLEVDDAHGAAVFGDDEWCAAGAGDGFHGAPNFLRQFSAVFDEVAGDRVDGAFADAATVNFYTGHAGGCGEGDELGVELCELTPTEVELLLREHDDAAAFRGFVGEGRELRGVRQLLR